MAPDDSATWLRSLRQAGIHLGLDRIRVLLRALGHPERKYNTILVAGTNGKGSTAAMLASILQYSGRKTGLFSSPALVDERESWMINGQPIGDASLDSSIGALHDAIEKTNLTPTYFEALTLIAFFAFADAHVDIAVIEVGMGGRTDATNVVKPLASVITPIGMDHVEYLGNTLRKIASHKAHIIHRGSIVLTTNDDPRVLAVLRKRAAKFGNRFIHVTDEHDTPLAGEFQRRNAALAVRAAQELGVDEHSIAQGVKNTRWRGRLEHLQVRGKDIWIDGGHNAHAIAATSRFFDANVPRPRLLVFGMMSDKDVEAVVALLFPLFDRVIATEPYPPRSVRAETFRGAMAIPDPDEAFRAALDAPEPGLVITGSLYLAGAAIAFFDKIRGHDSDRT